MALPLEDQRTILVVRPDRRRERDARQTTTFLRPPVLAAAVTLTAFGSSLPKHWRSSSGR
jgi:hypothetical protein